MVSSSRFTGSSAPVEPAGADGVAGTDAVGGLAAGATLAGGAPARASVRKIQIMSASCSAGDQLPACVQLEHVPLDEPACGLDINCRVSSCCWSSRTSPRRTTCTTGSTRNGEAGCERLPKSHSLSDRCISIFAETTSAIRRSCGSADAALPQNSNAIATPGALPHKPMSRIRGTLSARGRISRKESSPARRTAPTV